MQQKTDLPDLQSKNEALLTMLSHVPAMLFTKDASTGRYLSCNQSFAEYAHKSDPDGVIGLTDFDIFDEATAAHFTEDDRKAVRMDVPYIFVEDVPDAAGLLRHFQTTKLHFTDNTGKLCTLGMCVDITEMTQVKAAEAAARAKLEGLDERNALMTKMCSAACRPGSMCTYQSL